MKTITWIGIILLFTMILAPIGIIILIYVIISERLTDMKKEEGKYKQYEDEEWEKK